MSNPSVNNSDNVKTRKELADEIGISRSTLERAIKKEGLKIPKYCRLKLKHQKLIRQVVLIGLD